MLFQISDFICPDVKEIIKRFIDKNEIDSNDIDEIKKHFDNCLTCKTNISKNGKSFVKKNKFQLIKLITGI